MILPPNQRAVELIADLQWNFSNIARSFELPRKDLVCSEAWLSRALVYRHESLLVEDRWKNFLKTYNDWDSSLQGDFLVALETFEQDTERKWASLGFKEKPDKLQRLLVTVAYAIAKIKAHDAVADSSIS